MTLDDLIFYYTKYKVDLMSNRKKEKFKMIVMNVKMMMMIMVLVVGRK